jgi:hypothetical protein
MSSPHRAPSIMQCTLLQPCVHPCMCRSSWQHVATRKAAPRRSFGPPHEQQCQPCHGKGWQSSDDAKLEKIRTADSCSPNVHDSTTAAASTSPGPRLMTRQLMLRAQGWAASGVREHWAGSLGCGQSPVPNTLEREVDSQQEIIAMQQCKKARPGALGPPRAQNHGVWWLASVGLGPPGSHLWCRPLAMQAQRTLPMA